MAPKPIKTDTQIDRIRIYKNDFRARLARKCDNMGAAGYMLSSSVQIEGYLVLIFQRPPQ